MTLPGGGESVGEAYVRLFADGSGLGHSIANEFRDHANPELKKIGKEGAKEYEDGFDEQDREYARKLAERHLRDTVKDEQDQAKARDRIYRNSVAKLVRDNQSTERFMAKLRQKSLADAIQANLRANERQRRDDKAASVQRERDIRSETTRIAALIGRRYKVLNDLDKKFAVKDRDRLRRSADELFKRIKGGDAEAERELARLARGIEDVANRGERGFLRMSKATKLGVRDMGSLERKLHGVIGYLESHDLGKFFGQGSRNNFINAFGNLIGIVVRGISLGTVGAAEGLLRMGAGFRAAIKDGNGFRDVMKNLSRVVMPGLKAALGGVVATLVGIPAAFGAVVGMLQLIAGPLVAGISDLGGAVVALAGSIGFGLVGSVLAASSAISFGLIGAIGAALPLMFSLGLAAAAVGIAFAGMSTKQKAALKQTIKPLIGEFHNLQKAIRSGLFANLDKQIPLFKRDLASLDPLFHGIGVAVSDVATKFAKSFLDPQWRANLDVFNKFIPHALSSLGGSGARAFQGIANMMRALVPISNKLLASIHRVTQSFIDFTGSKRGQRDITNFFSSAYHTTRLLFSALSDVGKVLGDILGASHHIGNKLLGDLGSAFGRLHDFFNSKKGSADLQRFIVEAWHSAKLLGGALLNIAHVLGIVLAAGRPVGNFFVKTIGKAFHDLGKYLDSATGQHGLSQFFANAQSFMHVFSAALGAIGKLLIALDNTQSQSAIKAILGIIAAAITTITKAVPVVVKIIEQITPTIKNIANAAKGLIEKLAPIITDIAHYLGVVLVVAFRYLGPLIVDALHWLTNLLTFLEGHGHIVSILATAFITLWAAFKGYAIMKLVYQTFLVTIGRMLLSLDAMAAAGGLRAAFANIFVGEGTIVSRVGNFFGAIGTSISSGLARLRSLSFRARAIGSALTGALVGTIAGSLIGKNVGGTGGKVLGALGGAASGALVGSAFGGVGAVVGGVAGGITGLISAWHAQGNAAVTASARARAATIRQKQAVDNLLSSLQSVNGAYNKQYRATIAEELRQKGALGQAATAGINPNVVVRASLGDPAASFKLLDRYHALFSKMNALRSEAGTLPDATVKQQTAIESLLHTLYNLNPQFKQTERGFELMNLAVNGNAGAWKRLRSNIKEGFTGLTTSRSAFVAQSASAKSNTFYIEQLVKGFKRQTIAQALAGKTIKQTTTYYEENVQALRKQLIQMGLQAPAVDKLIRKYETLPSSKVTQLYAIDSASRLLDKVARKIGGIKPSRETRIRATIAGMNHLDRLDYLLRHLPKFRDIYFRTHITGPGVPSFHPKGGGTAFLSAAGRIVNGAQRLYAGEAGPEAIVPLNRPLDQVDPAVRALSAFAQGLPYAGNERPMAHGGIIGGKTFNFDQGAIQVVTPTQDPAAVANEFLNQLAASGLI